MKKLIYLLTIGITLVAWGCGSKKEAPESVASIDVTLAEVKGELSPEAITFSGKFLSDQTVNLSTKLTGTINYLRVEEGEAVKEGQLLAKVNSEDLRARKQQAVANLGEAKAQLETVEKDYDRIEKLHSSGSATDKELDDIRYARTAARSKVRSIESGVLELDELLNYSEVKAPFDGHVTRKHLAEGDLATPGMPILTVEASGKLKVVAKVPESELSSLETGDTVEVSGQAAGVKVHGIVAHINPSSVAGNLLFEATIQLPEVDNTRLKSGMYAEVRSTKNHEKKILIPQKAVFRQGQLTGVYTLNNQKKTSIRWIRTGAISGEKIEVLSGLTEGEQIVLESPVKLQSGLAVNITQ